jgi:hypothetical protein
MQYQKGETILSIFTACGANNVYTHKRLNTSSLYLSALAITDTMMLTLHILMELEYAWGKPTLRYPVWCTIFFVLFYFSQYMSPLLVFADLRR